MHPMEISLTRVSQVAMTCGGCEKAVRALVSKTPGVTSVDVDLETKRVKVTGTATKDLLLERINKAGKATEYLGTE